MKLVKLKDGVFVSPDEVCSVQHEELWRDYGSITDFVSTKYFDGSIVTLKNGRKIAINNLKPCEIFELLKGDEGE